MAGFFGQQASPGMSAPVIFFYCLLFVVSVMAATNCNIYGKGERGLDGILGIKGQLYTDQSRSQGSI